MRRTLVPMLLLLLAASAGATTITITAASSVANAQAIENAWVLSNFGSNFKPDILESFEEFTPSSQNTYTSLATAVGTFSVMSGSLPGDPVLSNGNKKDQFAILDAADSPYSGRYDTTPGGNNWLDSNDITQIKLTTSLSALFFMISDVNDSGGTLTIQTSDGTSSSAFAPPGVAQNGNLYFVAIKSSSSIGNVKWLNNSTNDGWGVDDFGTPVDPPPAATPEPRTLSIAAIGLVAIALGKKYRSRRSNAGV